MKINGLRLIVFPAKIRAVTRFGCSKKKCIKITDKKVRTEYFYSFLKNLIQSHIQLVSVCWP